MLWSLGWDVRQTARSCDGTERELRQVHPLVTFSVQSLNCTSEVGVLEHKCISAKLFKENCIWSIFIQQDHRIPKGKCLFLGLLSPASGKIPGIGWEHICPEEEELLCCDLKLEDLNTLFTSVLPLSNRKHSICGALRQAVVHSCELQGGFQVQGQPTHKILPPKEWKFLGLQIAVKYSGCFCWCNNTLPHKALNVAM